MIAEDFTTFDDQFNDAFNALKKTDKLIKAATRKKAEEKNEKEKKIT